MKLNLCAEISECTPPPSINSLAVFVPSLYTASIGVRNVNTVSEYHVISPQSSLKFKKLKYKENFKPSKP